MVTFWLYILEYNDTIYIFIYYVASACGGCHYSKRKPKMRRFALCLSLAVVSALADETVNLDAIQVESNVSKSPFLMENQTASPSVLRFGPESAAALGTQAAMNPYTVIQYAPSVNFTPVDATGSNEPSFHDPIRMRGRSQSGPGGVFLIDGLPISSNPGGGKQLVDMENIAAIDLYKGYIPTNLNTGFSSLIGKVDLRLRNPKEQMGGSLSQSVGSDNFLRTYVQLDSGKVGDVAVFGSFSQVSSDKNRGKGDLSKSNAMLGLRYTPNDAFEARVYAITNSDEHHNYGSLTYAEAQDIDTYWDKDFATARPTANNDVDYYDWNKQDFTTNVLMADIAYKVGSAGAIRLKPYYKSDKGEYWLSSFNADPTKQRVINWKMDHDLAGATLEYDHQVSAALAVKAGYWYHKQLPPGPPTDRKKYRVVSGELVFNGYASLADTDDHIIQAPFVELSGKNGAFEYKAGVQYQSFRIAELKSYTDLTNTTVSEDYDTAIAQSTLDPWASVDAKTFTTWIPSAHLGYNAANNDKLYMDYSRTYGFDVNLFPTYISNRAVFVGANVTLQELWDELELELSDNVELGYKTTVGSFTLNPSLYVMSVQNKQASLYDPAYGVTYPANVGKAQGYGVELAAYGELAPAWDLMVGASYNRYYFTENFKSNATTTVDIKGKQVPDAPETMIKAALSYRSASFTVTPSLRYNSSRYGDVTNTQKLDAYTLVDLDAVYHIGTVWGMENSKFRLTATNLTDEKYVSTIVTADNVLSASTTSSSYMAGAPLSVYGAFSFDF